MLIFCILILLRMLPADLQLATCTASSWLTDPLLHIGIGSMKWWRHTRRVVIIIDTSYAFIFLSLHHIFFSSHFRWNVYLTYLARRLLSWWASVWTFHVECECLQHDNFALPCVSTLRSAGRWASVLTTMSSSHNLRHLPFKMLLIPCDMRQNELSLAIVSSLTLA